MNTNTVILAEKPSQASAYAEAFQHSNRYDGYYVVSGNGLNKAVITYGFGHLVELFSPEDYDNDWHNWDMNRLPIFPKNYQFKVSKDKKKQYKIVKDKLDNATDIIIATDSDREGEAIARLIIRLSGNDFKPQKRLWINSLEKDEIITGFKNLKEGTQFYSSFIEAESRQIADWLVGMNLTRLYTLSMQKHQLNGVFSIGRVQTPTLFMIYKRNNEIDNFTSQPYFELYGHFSNEKGSYAGKLKRRFDTLKDLNDFRSEHELIDKKLGKVTDTRQETKKQYAPKLFSLSDLQSLANKKFGFSASETLKIVQELYEKKLTSYPRTDCTVIGNPEFAYLKAYLADYLRLLDISIKEPQLTANKRYVDSSKVQEHYAIIPTRTTLKDWKTLSKKEQSIYTLILKRTVSIFEKPYQYEETTIVTTVHAIDFHSTGKIEIEKGWKAILTTPSEEKDYLLPAIQKDDTVQSLFEQKEGHTQPPKYYTEGTLLSAMKNVGRSLDDVSKNILKETAGIGTEATRASIIENLKQKKYISIQSKKILVTNKGKLLCDMIKDDEIANAEMTAKWETYLKKIREKKGSQKAFLNSIQKFPGLFIILP